MKPISFVLVGVLGITLLAPCAIQAQEASPVSLPRTFQHDFKSKINGDTYRVMIGVPPRHEKEKPYPVIYVMEGNVYFASAMDALARQATFKNAAPAIVVGVGYPSDDLEVGFTRRWTDLTPTLDPKQQRKTGGGDIYLRVIEEEVKPLVESRLRIDKGKQALWGHSFGGVMVLRAMFRNPDSYATYLASSPAIWWDDSTVLKDEAGFRNWIESTQTTTKVLFSWGEKDSEMIIKQSSELHARLAAFPRTKLTVDRRAFEGETHISVSHIALISALRFAFPPAASP